ncbi:hypothetical protein K469DRAFT_374012 [Zopfia rhizophila CBS 207.26]|uniref:DUF7730 domain-containing protein n=1 Tax=Zopfia rhizophila CBS 207.26 TaxID=1314779 RepID=A0A6A6EIQ7_9PEZI|nr:hypothetical protein K469DRAFT_374012 [Zopfia rhizophila CBS 207.26]
MYLVRHFRKKRPRSGTPADNRVQYPDAEDRHHRSSQPRPQPVTPTSSSNMAQQMYCPLFSKLSAELRLLVYKASLGDLSRPTHILVMTKGFSFTRCLEPDPEKPGLDHKCGFPFYFAPSPGNDGFREYRMEPPYIPTRERLVSLLLTCRRIYYESVDILYTHNIFHIKLLGTLQLFSKCLMPHRFQSIRILHLSVVLQKKLRRWDDNIFYPPEDEAEWDNSCAVLASMIGLRELKIELRHSFWLERNPGELMNDEWLLRALKPLSTIQLEVPIFEVQIPFQLTGNVKSRLGQIRFEIIYGEPLW